MDHSSPTRTGHGSTKAKAILIGEHSTGTPP